MSRPQTYQCSAPLVRTLARQAVALSAGVIAILSITACASGTSAETSTTTADATAAAVAGRTVSKTAVAHWLSVEAIISREPNPQQPVPKGEVPDPPRYTACVAYMQATTPQAPSTPMKRTTAELKGECQKRYEAVRQRVIEILITYAWLSAEAAGQGITVSDSEVAQRFAAAKRERYPTEATFQRFLKYSGETLSDELFLQRFGLLVSKLDQKLISKGIPSATQFTRAFPRRWAAKTNCSPEYIVPDCRQYKGSLPPTAAS
jgi:foldase protein PrsA